MAELAEARRQITLSLSRVARAAPGYVTVARALAVAIAVMTLLPVLVIDMPPIVDYPNHLVRFWLLSGGVSISPISSYFRIDWSHTATNIMMDLWASLLGHLWPAHITGRIILGISALFPPAAACLVARRLYGRLSWWHILQFVNAWTLVLLTGFMSFQLSLGAAFVAIWLDDVMSEKSRWANLIRQSLQCFVILLIHPFGALFYFILAFGLAIGRDASIVWTPKAWLAPVTRLGWAALPFLLGGALMGLRIVLFGHSTPHAGLPSFIWDDSIFVDGDPTHLFWSFIIPWRSYSLPVDLTFLALLLLPIFVSLFQRRLVFHGGLAVTATALYIICIVAPQEIGTTSMIDMRLATMLAFLLPVAFLPQIEVGRQTPAILCTLAMLIVGARAMWITGVWQCRQTDIASLYRALDHVPAGARLLPLTVNLDDPDGDEPEGRYLGGLSPTYEHLPTLAVMRRHAYVPTVFAETGKQPLAVLPPYLNVHETSGGNLGMVEDLMAEDVDVDKYLPHWTANFDYILIVNADMSIEDSRIDRHACLITDEGFAKLYRIQKQPGPCA